MGDIRWVKFEVNMYDDTKLKIIDDLENRDSVHYFWTRFLVLCGKINRGGYLYITDFMPYTVKTLAIEFNRSVEEVKAAIKVLKKLEMIEFTVDKVFKIKNWEKHQNVEGMERYRQLNKERVANHRAKKKELNRNNNKEKNNNDVQDINEENNEKINNINVQTGENTSAFVEEIPNNGNDLENMNDNNEDNKCNVTGNFDNSDCNITVTPQIKKENKKEKKKKKESKREFENKDEDKKSIIESADKSKVQEVTEGADKTLTDNFSDDKSIESSEKTKINNSGQLTSSENEDTNYQESAKLLAYYENLTGILGGLNIGFLKVAIDTHGYKNVKMAINKALEVNKANMTYINGILKNWRREGYPKEEMEVKKNGVRSTGKNNNAEDKNEFAGFKPKEPRKLTEAERKKIEENLI